MRKTLQYPVGRVIDSGGKTKTGFTRRGVLKGAAAVLSAAAMTGCSSGDEDDRYVFVEPKDNLVYDEQMQTCFSTGAYNCGARCVHKIHYKNGRLYHMTSAGDIPRAGSRTQDNSPGEIGNPIQRRACVRGYGYIQRLYQPDRLKYPMVRIDKTKPRGDISNFKRVTWPEAIREAAKAIDAAIKRKQELKYTPIMSKWIGCSLDNFEKLCSNPTVAPAICHLGNESTGAADAAKFDMVGLDAHTNNVSDRLNSDFIITWGLDPSRATFYVEHAHWFNTVCKEQGTDIVVISPNHSDAAAMLSTGVKGYTFTRHPSLGSVEKTVDIPGWVPIRPATDGALAAAMAYVIYKNDLHDDPFIRQHCFGFYPNSDIPYVESSAPEWTIPPGENDPKPASTETLKNYYLPKGKSYTDPVTGTNYTAGSTYGSINFSVPNNESFVEYLLELEAIWGGGTYEGVLDYVAALTGVPQDIIEGLAFRYGKTTDAKPGFLDVGGGPQRAWNGVEWVQMMIALCAMTGNIVRQGGGTGYSMNAHTDTAPRMLMTYSSMLSKVEEMNAIYIPMNSWNHVALTGKDYRSPERFAEEIEISTLGNVPASSLLAKHAAGQKMVEIDVWFMNNYNGLHTIENVNKTLKAMDAIGTVICCDHTMTLTAAYSDIILPACTHYERVTHGVSLGSSAYFMAQAPLAGQRLYDTRSDNEIRNLILEELTKLGHSFNDATGEPDRYGNDTNPLAIDATLLGSYEYAFKGPSQVYLDRVDPNAVAPDFSVLENQGYVDYPIPKGTSIPAFQTCDTPGKLQNTTGRINFYSPLWGQIRPATDYPAPLKAEMVRLFGNEAEKEGFRNPTARYQPNIEGYEKFFDNGNPLTGNFTGFYSERSRRHYKLYYMTNKARNRAHTVFDNVAIIADQFKQCVYINPVDAAARGIKDGDMVYAFNDRGCTHLPAKVTHYIIPGVISIEHGAWYRASTETVKVWQDIEIDSNGAPVFKEIEMPVDIGGAENMLTMSMGGTEQYVGQAISAQGGPCEVSLFKPD